MTTRQTTETSNKKEHTMTTLQYSAIVKAAYDYVNEFGFDAFDGYAAQDAVAELMSEDIDDDTFDAAVELFCNTVNGAE